MPIPSPQVFAEECVRHALFLGVNPHYLIASAQLRSGLKDDTVDGRVGPYRITPEEWDAGRSAADLEVVLEKEQISGWRRQCLFAALNAFRAQSRLLDQLGRFPSAIELYEEQWPGQPVNVPDLEKAFKDTAALVDPAIVKITGQPIGAATSILEDVKGPASNPDADLNVPIATASEQKFVRMAPGIMEKLIADFGLKDFQAGGVLGNLGHECNGFNTMQEMKPLVPGSKGGFGWAQWTGSRRDEFEAFCKTQGLSTTSDEGNYGFLKVELSKAPHKSAITEIKPTTDIKAAVRVFEKEFEKASPDHKHFDRRDHWAGLAMVALKAKAALPDKLLPPAVLKILDQDLTYRVTATAKSQGNTMYWVVDQFGEQGGQTLVRQVGANAPEILAQDTTVFPLKAALVLPQQVQDALSAGLKPEPLPGPTIAVAVASDDEVAQRMFAEAKKADDTLVTRDAPNTNGGRVACAWAVNKIASLALGKPIGGGLSTVEMGKVLTAKHTQVPENQIGPGMVCISPTQGGNVGHVGIVGEIKPGGATIIYSNSSSRAVFSHAFTVTRWKNFYATRKGLPVLFYSVKKDTL